MSPHVLDYDAVRAVERLQSRGYQAYLVGGCVRDLLLGHNPKDFDIATSARPPHVKRTFPRNCRIIGRRFKLAHLHFHGNTKILEVSTFRRPPEETTDENGDEDLLITRDNEFGTAEEDALRRDFTINSLFLDPVKNEILDWTGGLQDLNARLLRTIGDPEVRFREDPVRIIRAIKFAGRLGLSIDKDTEDAMRATADDLKRAAPPRLLEELFRLLRSGHALDAFLRMRDIGALQAILPVVHDYLEDADREARVVFWRLLEALDGKKRLADQRQAEWPPENGVLLGAVFLQPVLSATATSGRRSPTSVAEELISPFATDFRLPRRDTGCVKRICGVQHRFESNGDGPRRFRPASFLHDPYFDEALELYQLSCVARGAGLDAYDTWRSRRDETEAPAVEPKVEEPRRRKKSRTPAKKERKPQDEPRSKSKRDRKGNKKKPRSQKGGNGDVERAMRRKNKVELIEPEAIDLSAFDVELDPKRVPTFGTIVEGGKKRKRSQLPSPEDDDYRPPPPPGGAPAPEDTGPGAPPPPPPAFGDW